MKKLLASLITAFVTFTANADTVTTTDILTRGANEYSPTVTGSVKVGTDSINGIFIGAMTAKFGTDVFAETFTMYCVDLFHGAGAKGVGYTYDKIDFVTDLNPFDKMGKLFTFNNGVANASASDSAAMQLAVWELLYDTTPGDVTSGLFKIGYGVTGTNVAQKANFLLAGAAGVTTNLWDVSYLSDNEYDLYGKGGRQDFITATFNSGGSCGLGNEVCAPVPEPSAIAMMLAGLGSIGFMAKRRRRV